jgi:hypothetical protein
MARVVAFIPDLLFGSRVTASLSAAGHEPVLAGDAETLRRELPGADALLVDLTADACARIEQVRRCRPPGMATLAFYAHVEPEVRELAERAGCDLVVPRSRVNREGPALVERLLRRRAQAG